MADPTDSDSKTTDTSEADASHASAANRHGRRGGHGGRDLPSVATIFSEGGTRCSICKDQGASFMWTCQWCPRTLDVCAVCRASSLSRSLGPHPCPGCGRRSAAHRAQFRSLAAQPRDAGGAERSAAALPGRRGAMLSRRLFLFDLNGTLGFRPRDNAAVAAAAGLAVSVLPWGTNRKPSRFYHRPGSAAVVQDAMASGMAWGFCTNMMLLNAMPIVEALLERACQSPVAIRQRQHDNSAALEVLVMRPWAHRWTRLCMTGLFALTLGYLPQRLLLGALLPLAGGASFFRRCSFWRRSWLHWKNSLLVCLADRRPKWFLRKAFWVFDMAHCRDDLHGQPYPNGNRPQIFDVDAIARAADVHPSSVLVASGSAEKMKAFPGNRVCCTDYTTDLVRRPGEDGLECVAAVLRGARALDALRVVSGGGWLVSGACAPLQM